MTACEQEMCSFWTGDGCLCEVAGIDAAHREPFQFEPYLYIHNFDDVADEGDEHVEDVGCWCGVILSSLGGRRRQLKHIHSPAPRGEDR